VLYAHAGILPAVAEALDHRKESSCGEDAGQKAVDALNTAVRRRLTNRTWTQIRDDDSTYFAEAGPLWTRHLARSMDTGLCFELEQSLRIFGATRMVVGHTAQADGKVHHRCHGRLLLGDTMISSAYKEGGHPSAIEVHPSGGATAIYPVGRTGRTAESLPSVGKLIDEIVAGVDGGGLTPLLRWHIHVLGLSTDINQTTDTLPTSKEVRRAYHRLSLARHPDKGGTQEEFQELQAAFQAVAGSLGSIV